jgi:putative restriction endonuclease
MAQVDPDHSIRLAAIAQIRALNDIYDDFVPLAELRQGFVVGGERFSFGSFHKGIHRPRQMSGPAALTVTTAPPKAGKAAPYDDEMDAEGGAILYRYRAGSVDQPDNRALRAAFELRAPLIYFHGVAPGQYLAVAPVFVTADDPVARCVVMEVGLPVADLQPGGPVSPPEVRAYALREVRMRLHQQRFRLNVLRAYSHRCAVCALRERQLLQAAHIVADPSPGGIAAVINGLALCAIHHLAFDRNLLGIDPAGAVHIARRLLDEKDGPMLREGLQGFHGASILKPRKTAEHPDPARLAIRFAEFEAA